MRSSLFAVALSLTFSVAALTAERSTPNVLFLIADDASPTFGVYGYDWVKTPNIDRLAKQGVVFENTYTPTAKCAPSRAAILTGRNPWQLEQGANHQTFFPAKFKVFTEALSDAGVYVGAQGKFWGPGDARTTAGEPRRWGLTTSGGDSQKPDGGAKFKQFLADRPKDKPFFFWFGSTNPHRAYAPDSGLAAGKKPSDIDHVPAYWPDNDVVRRDLLDYAVEVETYDAQVGGLLKVLEESGEAENTLVLVTSDHGMPFPRVKGHNYHASNHVPLIAAWPKGIVAGSRRVADFISFIDLAPTLLEVFGVSEEKSGLSAITGRSFLDLLKNKPAHDRSFVILGRERNDVYARPGSEAGLGYPVRGIREGNLLYLHNFKPDRWPCGNVELGLLDTDGGPTKSWLEAAGDSDRFWQFCFGKRPANELFDLASDPDCVKNLAEDASYRETATKLHDKLIAELKRQNDPRVSGQGDVFDNYPTTKPAPGSAPTKKAGKKKTKQ
jgi:N-sulfoglucosamine sulfohydrolase